MIDRARMNRDAAEILKRIDAPIHPAMRLRDLGIANKHLVAIARALSVDARVVIMDEPTASLSQKEIEELYELVDRLKAEGKAIRLADVDVVCGPCNRRRGAARGNAVTRGDAPSGSPNHPLPRQSLRVRS